MTPQHGGFVGHSGGTSWLQDEFFYVYLSTTSKRIINESGINSDYRACGGWIGRFDPDAGPEVNSSVVTNINEFSTFLIAKFLASFRP